MNTPILEGIRKKALLEERKEHPVERWGGVAGGVGGLLLGALAGSKLLGMRPDLHQPAGAIIGGVGGGLGGSVLGRILGRMAGTVGVGSEELERWKNEHSNT